MNKEPLISNVTLRSYRPDELPRLKEITVEAFDGVSIDQAIEAEFGILGEHDWRWRKARHLDVDLTRDGIEILVAEVEGQVAGFVTWWHDRPAALGHVSNLALSAPYRGRGLGKRLVVAALDALRAAGFKHAKIDTVVQNEVGIGLYTQLGFREVARQIHFVAEL